MVLRSGGHLRSSIYGAGLDKDSIVDKESDKLAPRTESRYHMEAVTGIFSSETEARRAIETLHLNGVDTKKVALLTPSNGRKPLESLPVDAAEQPGMGKVMGAVVGGASGLSAGGILVAAIIPGVGPVTAAGLLGAAILGAAGASVGAVAGGSIENSMTRGLPEDEIFVYEDALRKGRSVVVVLSDQEQGLAHIRELLKSSGAEAIDAARQQWWIGLRSAEHEHYSSSGRNFGDDEGFYRMGFEAALHARNRCKEFDQASAEMESNLEDLQKQYPNRDVAEPYTRGYRRGRDYYQRLCDESKAA